MLRSILIYLSQAGWARNLVTRWSFAWRVASRFVAGEQLDDALEVIKVLNDEGINSTLDHLGEHTSSELAARRATDDIIKIFGAINSSGVRSNVSIKLTQIGLLLDEDLCAQNLKKILVTAKENGIFVRIDMEDSSCVDVTLRLFHRMQAEYHLKNCGVVIQSYLYRSEEDVRKLIEGGTRIRLCKGAYDEPEEIAFPRKGDVDANYDHLTKLLIDGALINHSQVISNDGKVPPLLAVASHDPERLVFAKKYADEVGLIRGGVEIQMLYGIRRDLQDEYVSEGFPVRVYVPYGMEWYPYFVRRLAERPANLWFFISNFFRK
ncbi:proline dehydrogenase family protein [Chloroflexota bacterium]